MEENEKQASVPYFVHEGQMARMERIIHKLSTTIILVLAVALVMFVVNNVIWLNYVRNNKTTDKTEITEVSDAGVYQQPDQGPD